MLVDYQLAGAGYLSRATQLGVLDQPAGPIAEKLVHASRRVRVVGSDVVPDVNAVLQSLGCPDKLHARSAISARRAANCASTSSLGAVSYTHLTLPTNREV